MIFLQIHEILEFTRIIWYSKNMMIRVFAMDVQGRDFLGEQWSRYLSGERRDAASKMRQEESRRLFLGAEILLNRSLEEMRVPVSFPAAYRRNEHGKPYLLSPKGLYVNWSHSGTCVLCALSDHEVGVDLQYIGKEPKDSLVRRVLQPEERPRYDGAEEGQKRRLFYEYWTVKESFLKAMGTGFYTSLDTFWVRMEGRCPEIVRRNAGLPYTCRILDFSGGDYAAAVCVEGMHSDMEECIPIEYI